MFWKVFSLLSVSAAFLALVVWVYLPRNKTRFDAYRSIPLEHDGSKISHANPTENSP